MVSAKLFDFSAAVFFRIPQQKLGERYSHFRKKHRKREGRGSFRRRNRSRHIPKGFSHPLRRTWFHQDKSKGVASLEMISISIYMVAAFSAQNKMNQIMRPHCRAERMTCGTLFSAAEINFKRVYSYSLLFKYALSVNIKSRISNKSHSLCQEQLFIIILT